MGLFTTSSRPSPEQNSINNDDIESRRLFYITAAIAIIGQSIANSATEIEAINPDDHFSAKFGYMVGVANSQEDTKIAKLENNKDNFTETSDAIQSRSSELTMLEQARNNTALAYKHDQPVKPRTNRTVFDEQQSNFDLAA